MCKRARYMRTSNYIKDYQCFISLSNLSYFTKDPTNGWAVLMLFISPYIIVLKRRESISKDVY